MTLGFEPIAFAIIGILAIEAGLLTPPFGLLVYTVKAAIQDDDVSIASIFLILNSVLDHYSAGYGRHRTVSANRYFFTESGVFIMLTKAIRIEQQGEPEVMQWQDVELPEPGPDEVLIRHTAVGLNYIDTYHRSGHYKLPLPSGLGSEAAGVIESVGWQRYAI